jgi:hypothetical protein
VFSGNLDQCCSQSTCLFRTRGIFPFRIPVSRAA